MKIKFISILLILFVVVVSCEEKKSKLSNLSITSVEKLSKPLIVVTSSGNDTLVFNDSLSNYSLDKYTDGEFVQLVYGRTTYPLYLNSEFPFSINVESENKINNKEVVYLGSGAEIQRYLLSSDKLTDELFLKYDVKNMSENQLQNVLDSINEVKLSLENNIPISDEFLKHNFKASSFYFDALIKTYYLFWNADDNTLYQPKNNNFLDFKKQVVYNDDLLINNSVYIDYLMIDLESELYGKDISASKSAVAMLSILETKNTSVSVLNKLSFNITERHIKANKANHTKETVALFKQLNSNAENINDIEQDVKAIARFFEGEKAPEFTFENKDQQKISLSDFKGKLVYIDFWATWCGPCRKEIPFLKELEHEFKNKEIVFISISIDRLSDYDKWKAMLVENEMSGVQLYAGNETPVLAEYDIQFIPRFVLVDKEGNFINSSAPKPSSKDEIVELFNHYLEN